MLNPYKSKMGIIYVILKTMCPPDDPHMALWQLMPLDTWCMVIYCWYQWNKKCSTSYARSGCNWSMTHRVLKSHKSKMGVIYICNYENNMSSRLLMAWFVACGLWLVAAHSFGLWALFWSLVTVVCNCTSCAQKHELPQSNCGDDGRAHCFHDYIYLYYCMH